MLRNNTYPRQRNSAKYLRNFGISKPIILWGHKKENGNCLTKSATSEAVNRIEGEIPYFLTVGMNLPWHAFLVTDWCEAHGTMYHCGTVPKQ